ncbi:MAG: nucleotidyltransferase family protein [Oscillospiraceae bacterium]|nr:nucleotidyltransferase family protein [Oscillospiraceae bacterium]
MTTCIVLAAGYATRLYPLTYNFPKPLLEVKGKSILDRLLDDISSIDIVSRYVIISNHKFASHFTDWAKSSALPLTILDDGSVSNETRLGAVRDVQFAIDRLSLDEDLLVVAADNLLDFSLAGFVSYAKAKETTCIMRYFELDTERLRKAGVVEADDSDRITRMEEKPTQPFSNWCAPPFYFCAKKDLHFVEEAIAGGCGTDAPGSFIAWLSRRTAVHAMKMQGNRFDIGDLASYEQAQNEYDGISARLDRL